VLGFGGINADEAHTPPFSIMDVIAVHDTLYNAVITTT
jgi:hypothetical protein